MLYTLMTVLCTFGITFYLLTEVFPTSVYDKDFKYTFNWENAALGYVLGVILGILWPLGVPGILIYHYYLRET